MNEHTRAALIVGAATVVIFALLIGAALTMKVFDEPVRLPFLVIVGVMALLGVLAAMAIAFKAVHLANQTQALGLPDGTVRAVIALSLIVIFATITVYLFSDLSDTNAVECTAVKQLRADFEKRLPAPPRSQGTRTMTPNRTDGSDVLLAAAVPAQLTVTMPPTSTDPTAPASTQATATTDPADERRKTKAAAAHDFAKQLLIMLGTLITSITSFYFGSKTATDVPGARPAPSAPKLVSVEPHNTDPKSFTGHGSGLLLADAVSLRN